MEMKKSRRRAEGPLESDSVIAKAQVTPLLVTQRARALPVDANILHREAQVP